MKVELHQPGYIRAILRKAGEATKIEWAHDSSWRFLKPVFKEDVGFCLHPIDLAINKVLALAGRDEPRDFLDVIHSHKHILELPGLVWAACGKDPGFTPHSLLELLQRKGKYRQSDFSRLHLNIEIDLVEMKQTWLKMLSDTREVCDQLPAEELGCLYYDITKKAFVTPSSPRPKDVVNHYGQDGGVLPRIR